MTSEEKSLYRKIDQRFRLFAVLKKLEGNRLGRKKENKSTYQPFTLLASKQALGFRLPSDRDKR